MKISKLRIKQLIKESIIKEFRETGMNFLDFNDLTSGGGGDLPPPEEPRGGGGDDEPQWGGMGSYWIWKLNPDHSPSKEKILIDYSTFKTIMNVYKRLEILSEQDQSNLSPDIYKEVLSPLWSLDHKYNGHLIAVDSPIAWFGQHYQIHVCALNQHYDTLMQLITVEIISGTLSDEWEHNFKSK